LRGFGFDEKQASRQKGSRLPTIRDIYTPLTHFAQQEGAAVIVTHHFRKMLAEERRHLSPKRKKGKDVAPDIDIHTLRNLIAGTADIVNAARHALVLVSDLEAGIGTLVPVKSNRSQVLGAPIRYDWHTDTPTFLSFLDEDDTAMEKAFAFFRRVLAEGALPSDEVKAQAKKEGISERTLWRAKERMGVKAEKQLLHGKAVWMWFLPHHPDLHPEGCEEAEGDPSCNIDPEGGTTGPALHPDRDTDEDPRIPENLAELAEYNGKPMENIALSTLPNKNGLWQSWQRPETVRVCQVCQTENTLAETLAETQVPVKSSTYNHLCQDCQGFDVSEAAHPEGDHSCNIEPGSPERMSRIEPGGRVVLSWDGKTETVSPTDLAGWRPIEEIPEVPLPNMESVEIPPVVVVDIETTGLDWERDRLLAVGVALYRDGREVDAKIFSSESGEAALLAHTFEYLRDVTKRVGEIILTGYNVADFDLPFLVWRAHVLRVECPFRFLRDREGHITKWRVAATAGTLRSDPLEYPALRTDLPISVVDTLHLVCRWDYTAKALRHYNLKSVAAHFGVHQPDRPVLSPAQIQHAFKHDPETFEAYLLADLRETYALFAKLIPPYAAIAAITELPLDQVVTRSTAWMWEQILKRHYGVTQQPDEKVDYEGGLVVSRKGVWSPCLKLDVASLYPTIMLAYRIHSRKDPDQVALRWLKTLTEQRLALKAKAKKGDERAHILQDAMKILINSLYGFYGTGGYGFNDMSAAEKVTEKGRKILTSMIAAVEEAGGIIVEADTDGIIVCTRHTDPQALVHAVTAAIPEVFTVEVEWQDAICFVSDDKNYIVLPQDGDPITKGSKWRGRDKEAYLTQAIPTFVRLWATEGEDAAMRFANTVEDEIRRGHGWRWVVRAHRVGKNDKFLLQAGFRVGEYATYAYKEKTKGAIARDPHEGYDREYYARKFVETVREVLAAIRATESPSDNDCHKAILSDGPTII
jgi:DNA polymerase III epsilon subunit-like protein